jgi:hypothetical protein
MFWRRPKKPVPVFCVGEEVFLKDSRGCYSQARITNILKDGSGKMFIQFTWLNSKGENLGPVMIPLKEFIYCHAENLFTSLQSTEEQTLGTQDASAGSHDSAPEATKE